MANRRIFQTPLVLAMADLRGARMLGGDVLNQCSAERNVHDLDAAANAKDVGILCRSAESKRSISN